MQDVLSLAMWVGGFFGNTIVWRGQKYYLRPDGRFRRVIVQVVTRPELRPRTRLGYTADGVAAAAPTHSSASLPQ